MLSNDLIDKFQIPESTTTAEAAFHALAREVGVPSAKAAEIWARKRQDPMNLKQRAMEKFRKNNAKTTA